jgi:PAS domain S-box-containing protein/putative nucleotidyltransferase with HDIG domain
MQEMATHTSNDMKKKTHTTRTPTDQAPVNGVACPPHTTSDTINTACLPPSDPWLILNTLPDLIALLNPDGTIRYLNAAWQQTIKHITVYPSLPSAAPGSAYLPLHASLFTHSPQDYQVLARSIHTVATREQEQFSREVPTLLRNGQERIIELTILPYPDPAAPGVLMQQRDITAHVQANRNTRALQESEERFRLLAENAQDIIFRYRLLPTHGFEYISPAVASILGYAPEDYYADPNFDLKLLHPDSPPVLGVFGNSPESSHETIIMRVLCKDGSDIWLEQHQWPIKDENDHTVAIEGISRDITRRKLAEERLRESEERYRCLIETSPDAISLIRLDGTIAVGNQSAADLVGMESPAALVGKNALAFITPEERKRVQRDVRRVIKTGSGKNRRYQLVRVDSRARVAVEMSMSVVQSAEGKPDALITITRDISQQVQRERKREAIVRVSGALRTAIDRTDLIATLLNQVITLLNSQGVGLLLHQPERNELVVEMAVGELTRMRGKRIRRGTGISGRVLATGKPYLTNDARNDPLLAWPDMIGKTRALACVPLIAHDQPIGALCAARFHPLNNEDMHILSTIGSIAANALHRIILHEQMEHRLQQVQSLHTIDHIIASCLDLNLSLSVVLDHAMIHLNMDAAMVLVLNPDTALLEYAASRGFRSSDIQCYPSLRIGEGFAGRAAQERCVVSIFDVSQEAADTPSSSLLTSMEFSTYYGVPLIAKGQIKGVLELFSRAPYYPDQEWLTFLEALAGQAALAIENATLFAQLQEKNQQLTHAYNATLEGWVHALDMRDSETEEHSQRVVALTEQLCRAMGYDDEALEHIRRGALLHDIGKIGVPDEILRKPGPLSAEEMAIMRQHTDHAYTLLSRISFLHPSLEIPYCHHERWDGSGYPQGLQGEAIPHIARIFAVVDVWDALNSDRPYRKAWPRDQVIAYIRDQAGKHFDPRVVEVFLKVIDEDNLPA